MVGSIYLFFCLKCWEVVILLFVFRLRPGVVRYQLSSRIGNAHSLATKGDERNSGKKNLGRLLDKLSVTVFDFYTTGAM